MTTQHSLPEVPDAAVEAILKRREVLKHHRGMARRSIRADLRAALPSLHAAFEKERAEQFGPEIEDWVGPDGETYSSLNQRERAMLDSACINQKRREAVEASPNVLSKEEAREVVEIAGLAAKGSDPIWSIVRRLFDWAEERTGAQDQCQSCGGTEFHEGGCEAEMPNLGAGTDHE